MNQPSPLADAIAAFQRGDLDLARSLAEQRHGSADAEHLLGLIHSRRGDFASGAEHFRRAAEAEPANPSHQLMLARALVDAGRATEVLAMPAPDRNSRPESLAMWHVRAEAATAAQQHLEAAAAWKIVCSARRSDWRCWANYGEALSRLERWQDAAGAFRESSALNPSEPTLRQNYASALVRSRRYDEAAEELRLMVDSGNDDVGIRLTLSRLLADLGRHDDSVAELDKAARLTIGEDAISQVDVGLIRIALPNRLDNGAPPTEQEIRDLRELALLLERTNRMDALRNLLVDAERLGISRDRLGYPAAAIALRDGNAAEAKRLLELESPALDPVRWHRLRGKILDVLGDPQAAIDAADAMHRSVPDYEGWLERAAAYRRRIHGLAQLMTSEWAARAPTLDPGLRRSPAFLVGFPRSGTTLLDTFLMGHPGTAVLEEFHMLRAGETLLGDIALLPERSPSELERARQAYFTELDRHLDPDFSGLVIDKLPLNMLRLPLIYSLFPDARVIFAQRHPCDVVLSGLMQSFAMNDAMACYLTLEGAADFYDGALSLWTRSREIVPCQVHTSVYETLVADPEASLRPLLEFLGLEWHDELLDHRSTAARRGAINTPSYDQVIEPLTTRPRGRWRRYEKQLAPVLSVLLPWAERLGYAA